MTHPFLEHDTQGRTEIFSLMYDMGIFEIGQKFSDPTGTRTPGYRPSALPLCYRDLQLIPVFW
jgi:hypothetical protein